MFKNNSFAVAAALCTALALPAAAQDAETVMARVGDAQITLGHVIALRQQLPQQFQQVPDETLFPAIVEQLIEQELLLQTQRDTLTDAEELMLENELRSFVANAALMRVANDAVTDETVNAAYQAYAAEYAQGDPVVEYHAAHILVRTEDERDQVVAALAEGRDFAEVAGEFSIDGSRAQGGDLGWFAAGVMIPDFQAAVEALEPGQVSEPVQTRFGWHVIKLFETRTAAVPPLADVQQELVQTLQREATRAMVAQLREGVEIENLSAGVDPSVLGRAELLDE
jgi:peptidyl-prolyl cis-trans isomerase C